MTKNKSFNTKQVLSRGVSEILPNKKSLTKLMQKRKIKVYLGIDPTGAVLHLGHAVALRKLQQFADLGHNVILLIGNGTVKIGDPTGRDKSRPILTDEQIEQNFKNWKKQASKILDFKTITVKRNADWLDQMKLPDFIKLMAKSTVAQLMERDMFQQRLKNNLPIFTHEIMYPLLQGYDSVAMNVDLEIGGTDQTFNMMMGRTLQKIYNNKDKWVLTVPLILGTDGRKMSKSYHNFVALTEAPQDMYGKLMSLKDELIIEYMSILTDISQKEINNIESDIKNGANPMMYKKKLAFEITSMLHDKKQAQQAQKHFERVFQKGKTPTQMKKVKVEEKNVKILDLITLCLPKQSRSQLKRLIKQKAVELLPAEKTITDINYLVDITDEMIVRIGKKRYFQIEYNHD